MSGNGPEGLDKGLLELVRAHRPSEAVRRQAEATGLDLESLKTADPLTYAAVNAVALVRTDAQLAAQVNAVLAQTSPHAQLFTVPLTSVQTDTELRVFPPLQKRELDAFDDALGNVATQTGGLFYRTVADAMGERRELAWPLAPGSWQTGTALVGPFADEAAANAWGQSHIDPRAGFVYDALPYAGAWYCDVFRGD